MTSPASAPTAAPSQGVRPISSPPRASIQALAAAPAAKPPPLKPPVVVRTHWSQKGRLGVVNLVGVRRLLTYSGYRHGAWHRRLSLSYPEGIAHPHQSGAEHDVGDEGKV